MLFLQLLFHTANSATFPDQIYYTSWTQSNKSIRLQLFSKKGSTDFYQKIVDFEVFTCFIIFKWYFHLGPVLSFSL